MNRRIIFGTDGIRGNANEFPFTPMDVYYLGKAIGAWSHTKYAHRPRILIAADTRISGIRIKNALMHGLNATRVHFEDAGILPTPAVLALIEKDSNFDSGLVISASHNPAQDNGIKFFDRATGKISRQDEQIISDFFNQFSAHQETVMQSIDVPPHNFSLVDQITHFYEHYKEMICARFDSALLVGRTIVIDAAHGATFQIAADIFRELGANVITIGSMPTGLNINAGCGALHPEFLQETVAAKKADLGIAFDGDGDRLVMVTRHGAIKDGDDILAILATHPAYEASTAIVGTIMTNHGLAMHLARSNKELIRTAVGDKYIIEQLSARKLLLGGETSGHIIATDYLASGDGIFAALRTIETMILHDNWDMVSFEKFPQIAINMPITQEYSLTQEPLSSIIATHEAMLPQGRIIVRFSGTEPILRVMTEDNNATLARNVAGQLVAALASAFSTYTIIPTEKQQYEL